MKSKKIKVGAAAMALVFAMSGSAFAAGGGPTPDYPGTTGDAEYQTNADTTISILSSTQNAGDMSYTVPLYVTMAVSNGEDYASVPLNYGIMNTSKQKTPGAKGDMAIGVTGMSFQKISDANDYITVDTAPTGTADADLKKVMLTIGGVVMPGLTRQMSVTLTDTVMNAAASGTYPAKGYGDLSGANVVNVFKNPDGSCKPIEVSNQIYQIPIIAKISNATTQRTDQKAAAQFRVRFSVSLLGAGNKPLGTTYAGSDYHQAGLDAAPTK